VGTVDVGSELELLADGRLRDTEQLGNLPLTHALGDHRAQRNRATQPGDFLVPTRAAVLSK